MKWQDKGIILSARPHGESSLVLALMTAEHGRHMGLVRRGRRGGETYQMGNLVSATWQGRLEGHLGSWQLETLYSPLPYLLDRGLALRFLASACGCLDKVLAERTPAPSLFHGLRVFIESYALSHKNAFFGPYVALERALLAENGLVLDFTQCAATGERSDLCYVSPRSGRAVSAAGGAAYRDRLLPLPPFLRPGYTGEDIEAGDFCAALKMLSFFLDRFVFAPHHVRMPDVRRFAVDGAWAAAQKKSTTPPRPHQQDRKL